MRLEFFRWGNDNCLLLRLILFTDDATYSRDGNNNTRITHWWSEENPHATMLKILGIACLPTCGAVSSIII
jgi:hypothetical protein